MHMQKRLKVFVACSYTEHQKLQRSWKWRAKRRSWKKDGGSTWTMFSPSTSEKVENIKSSLFFCWLSMHFVRLGSTLTSSGSRIQSHIGVPCPRTQIHPCWTSVWKKDSTWQFLGLKSTMKEWEILATCTIGIILNYVLINKWTTAHPPRDAKHGNSIHPSSREPLLKR